jgi:hypothetical protein
MSEKIGASLLQTSISKEGVSWIDIQRQDLRLKREFAQTHKWREYYSAAPLIIGEVPKEERNLFDLINLEDQFSADFYDQSSSQPEIAILHQQMPKTLGFIARHLTLLGDPQVVLDDLTIEKSFAKKGSSPLTGADFHIDPALYLFSNYPTRFYLGRARARYLTSENTEIDEHLLSTPHVIYTAPPFKIVWKGPWDVHAGPVYREDGVRIFGVGLTSDDRHNAVTSF